jgi:hypothetical protein
LTVTVPVTMLARMRTVLAAIVCTVLVSGCGGTNPVEKSFGGLSDKDMTAVQNVSTALQSAGQDFATMNAHLQAENIPDARSSLDNATAQLDTADDKTLDVDNSQLRSALQDYVGVTRGVLTAFDRWITYYEDDTMPRDEALENEMLSDIDTASTAARKADQQFLNRLLDNANPEQRKMIRERYRDALNQLEDTASAEG